MKDGEIAGDFVCSKKDICEIYYEGWGGCMRKESSGQQCVETFQWRERTSDEISD